MTTRSKSEAFKAEYAKSWGWYRDRDLVRELKEAWSQVYPFLLLAAVFMLVVFTYWSMSDSFVK